MLPKQKKKQIKGCHYKATYKAAKTKPNTRLPKQNQILGCHNKTIYAENSLL